MVTPPTDPYPFAPHWFDRGNWRMHYLDEGAGSPVVMVHGNPTWSFYYRNLVRALAPTHRCIVPDHVGCGRSDKPTLEQYPYTLKNRVDDLDALLENVGATSGVTLVLHDWGGMIGMAWAHRHPERVRRLVLLNTGAFFLPKSKPFPWPLWLGRNTSLGAWLILKHNAFCRVAAKVCVKRHPLPPAVREAFLAPYDSPAHRIAVLRFVQDIPLRPSDASYSLVQEVADGLHRFVDVPTLICWGAKDFVFDDHFLSEWKKRLPKAEVHRYADAGHYVLEDCVDEVVPLVREFVERS